MFDRGDYWQCAYVIPKGGFEQVQARGLDAFRAERGGDCAVPVGPRRGDPALERCEAADGHGRSAAAMVPAGPALHRRRRARDVSDRRRRHQPRDAGCRRRGEHLERPAGPRRVSRFRPGSGAEEARVPDSRRSAGSAARAGPVSEENPGRPRASEDAGGAQTAAAIPDACDAFRRGW